MSIREQAGRSTCSCEACRVGCRTMPGMCGVGDVERIAEHLGRPTEQVLAENFVAGDGARMARISADCRSVEQFDIPTMTPRQQPDGCCVFYEKDSGLCGIHAVSPFGCACFDSHMSREAKGDMLMKAALLEICDSPTYQQQWYALRHAGCVARPTKERRAAFEQEYAQVKARA